MRAFRKHCGINAIALWRNLIVCVVSCRRIIADLRQFFWSNTKTLECYKSPSHTMQTKQTKQTSCCCWSLCFFWLKRSAFISGSYIWVMLTHLTICRMHTVGIYTCEGILPSQGVLTCLVQLIIFNTYRRIFHTYKIKSISKYTPILRACSKHCDINHHSFCSGFSSFSTTKKLGWLSRNVKINKNSMLQLFILLIQNCS